MVSTGYPVCHEDLCLCTWNLSLVALDRYEDWHESVWSPHFLPYMVSTGDLFICLEKLNNHMVSVIREGSLFFAPLEGPSLFLFFARILQVCS